MNKPVVVSGCITAAVGFLVIHALNSFFSSAYMSGGIVLDVRYEHMGRRLGSKRMLNN